MSIELFLDKIEDEQVREALRRVESEINTNPLTGINWISLTASLVLGPNIVKHGLGGVPRHILISSADNPAAEVLIFPRRSTKESVYIASSHPTRVTLLLGG